MNQRIYKQLEGTVLDQFPIRSRATGWFFRVLEVSPGFFLVEGTDLWGRTISKGGLNPDELLEECESWAHGEVE